MEDFRHSGPNNPASLSSLDNHITTSREIMSPDTYSGLIKEIASLTTELNTHKTETHKKIESLNVRTSFQLQLLKERLLTLESRVAELSEQINTDTRVEAANNTLQKKIELIGKHMADLGSDINRLVPGSAKNDTNDTNLLSPAGGSLPGSTGDTSSTSNVKVNNNITTVNNIPTGGSPGSTVTKIETQTNDGQPNPPVQTTTTTTQIEGGSVSARSLGLQRPSQITANVPQVSADSTQIGASRLQSTVQAIPEHPNESNLSNVPSVDSSASLNIFDLIPRPGPTVQQPDNMSRPLLNNMNSYSDNSLIDINRQWLKALGIRSPVVGSPFTPKPNAFDYPIPINRALSFNRQLDMNNENNLAGFAGTNPSNLNPMGASNLSEITGSLDLMGNSSHPQSQVMVDTMEKRKMDSMMSLDKNINPMYSNQMAQSQMFDNLIESELQPGQKRQRKSSKSSDSSEHKSPNSGSFSSKAISGMEYPQYKLEKGARNVDEIWKEYEYGVNGKPPLKQLEIKYNAKWRNETELRTFVRRKKIYNAIESGKRLGYDENDVIKELEDSRTYFSNGTVKKRPLSWLYTNIPKKFQHRDS